MKKNNAGLLTMIALTGMVWNVQASLVFTDNFDRTVASTANGADIGSGYVISSTSPTAGKFQLSGTQLAGGGGTGSANLVLSYQGLVASNTAGSSFQASMDVSCATFNNGLQNGLAFNYQNSTNFYFARISNGGSLGAGYLVFGQIVNGTLSTFTETATGLSIAASTAYTLTISSDTAGEFGYSLIGGTVNLSGTALDTVGGIDFSNGYVGAYAIISNSNQRFDNFSVTTIPEPATLGMIGLSTGLLLTLRRLSI
ncbi:MAG: PEP-CTERM sorting domain-containing protein [Kiritimatiellales bacterium]|nr:PEP-CTERM sorting domain-containing protein [Kiritimatiellales bacterium]